ncbi:MAG: glucosamine--fructose-6-phosphate aminotransferase, partial [Clostridiaceae bacterium]|nr:glucosamine--fructose-6-phosphate aminotransferase [Clostridiaceae bacterium]
MNKNGALTYKEVYGQPESFKGINDTLEEIYKVLDEVFAKENQ